MSINPYESPSVESLAVGVKSGKRADLKNVAIAQKGINVCILIYLLAIVSLFVIPPPYSLIVSLIVLFDGVVATVFVFMLAIKVYNIPAGIILGILTLVPCLGLVVLLLINS